MPQRATKIVATLGPASSDPALLEAMIRAGVNVVRLNFSHGTAQDHVDRATLVREAAQRAGREVGIMADLQGPKIRVGKFAQGKVLLEPGMPFVLDASRTELGDIEGVGLDPERVCLIRVVRHRRLDGRDRRGSGLARRRATPSTAPAPPSRRRPCAVRKS